MITLILMYKRETLTNFQAWAVPCVGDQISYEEVIYTVVQRAFQYNGGITSVVCVVDRA